MKPIFHSVDSATKNLFSRGYTRLFLGFFSALVSFSLLVAPHEARAQAQASNGVIEGTVTDASGAVVPNAKVKVLNIDTGLEREALTNEKGLYRVQLLPVGNYQVTVTLTGFNAFVQSGITLSAGQAATVDVALKTGAPILTGTNILTTSNAKLIATGGFPQRIFQLGFKFHF
jgi:Carboxypeptidase regulatory-like domain